MTTRRFALVMVTGLALLLPACTAAPPATGVRASGTVEATDVQLAPEVGGRLVTLAVVEGQRIAAGDVIATLDTTTTRLALRRAAADRDRALAQLALLEAGARAEDIRQAEAQVRTAEAEAGGARDDLAHAEADLQRFETLLASKSGSQKQRDDAATRRDAARARVLASDERTRAAQEGVTRLRRGARPQELAAARAAVASIDAQIATLEQQVTDATVVAPVGGVVTQTLADVGEILAPRVPIVTIVDLDRAWANVYIDEPLVPRITLGQDATLYTDAGGPGITGKVTFVSPKAEFTPRNVQTAQERSKLVYRIKVTVDNRAGVLKQGMPIEADVPFTK
jgi:HlyD family secretion protein